MMEMDRSSAQQRRATKNKISAELARRYKNAQRHNQLLLPQHEIDSNQVDDRSQGDGYEGLLIKELETLVRTFRHGYDGLASLPLTAYGTLDLVIMLQWPMANLVAQHEPFQAAELNLLGSHLKPELQRDLNDAANRYAELLGEQEQLR